MPSSSFSVITVSLSTIGEQPAADLWGLAHRSSVRALSSAGPASLPKPPERAGTPIHGVPAFHVSTAPHERGERRPGRADDQLPTMDRERPTGPRGPDNTSSPRTVRLPGTRVTLLHHRAAGVEH